MNHARLILIASFAASFAGYLYSRGVYFLTEADPAVGGLGFGKTGNLWLALVGGVGYVIGAFASHAVSIRLGEKRLLIITLIGQTVAAAVVIAPDFVIGTLAPGLADAGHADGKLALRLTTLTLVVSWIIVSVLHGMMWPLVESYVAAGRSGIDQSRSTGWFNLAWAGAAPLGMAAAGPLLAWWWGSMFIVTAAGMLVGYVLIRRIADRPTHLPHDHPDRPPHATMLRYHRLLLTSRPALLCMYALVYILAPLFPAIYTRVGMTDVALAPALSAIPEVVRWIVFFALFATHRWHGNAVMVIAAVLLLPVGFFLTLLGPTLPVVLVGEALFGLAEGVIYFTALYYALVVKNASVDAGGAHEALIGVGFTVGPIAGLAGQYLTRTWDDPIWGNLVGIGPLILLCTAASLWPWFAAAPAGRPPA